MRSRRIGCLQPPAWKSALAGRGTAGLAGAAVPRLDAQPAFPGRCGLAGGSHGVLQLIVGFALGATGDLDSAPVALPVVSVLTEIAVFALTVPGWAWARGGA